MKNLLLFLSLSLAWALPAHAQVPNGVNGPVRQFGVITPGDCASWLSNNYIQDAGPCGGGGTGTPGGATNSVQYNAGGGNFGGIAVPAGDILVGQTSAHPSAVALSGDATIATTGAITVTQSAGAFNSIGNFSVNTNKFNVTASSGNTLIAGTLGITGLTTAVGATFSSPVAIGTTAQTAGTALDLGTNTNSILLPVGTTGQRPGSPVVGEIRYNSTSNAFEGYSGSSPAWGGFGGIASIPLGAGLTITQGSANATPVVSGSSVFLQTFPNTFTGTHTVGASEAAGVDICNSSSALTMNLPQAGATGFLSGTTYSFMNINTGTCTIATTTSVFNGMPLTSTNIALAQYGFAYCTSDGTNWNCSGSTSAGGGSGTVNSGTSGQFAYYASSTNAVSGNSTYTTSTVPLLNANNTYTAANRVTPSTDSISTVTFTPDFNASNNHNITLVHASCPCTLANPTNISAGQAGQIVINQSSTGSDLITTYGSDYVFTNGSGPVLSTAANAQDIFSYYVVDSTHIRISPLLSTGVVSETATPTTGTGITSATCASATCTNLRGTYTIVGGTATTGTILSLAWTATPTAYVCTATMNGGTGFLGIGNSVATTTGFNITAGVTVIGVTFNVNYSCEP